MGLLGFSHGDSPPAIPGHRRAALSPGWAQAGRCAGLRVQPCPPTLSQPLLPPREPLCFSPPISSKFCVQIITITSPHTLLIFRGHLFDKPIFSANFLFLQKAEHLSSQFRKSVVRGKKRKWKKGFFPPPPNPDTRLGSALPLSALDGIMHHE